MTTEPTASATKTRRWALGIGLLAVVGTGAGLALRGVSTPKSSTSPVLRVGMQRGGARSTMQAAGVLDNLPYKVEWAEFQTAQQQLEAISANALDLAVVGGPSFLFAYNNNGDLRAIQALRGPRHQRVVGIVVAANSPIKTLADLRGGEVATTRGSAGHSILLQALEQGGLSAKDVKISFLAPSDGLSALSTGRVDALAIWTPFLAIAVLHQNARVISYADSDKPSYMFQVTSVKSIQDKRALLDDFGGRYGQAQLWSNRHPDQAGAALARETGLPEDVALYTAKAMQWEPTPIDDAVIQSQREAARYFAADLPLPHRDVAGGFVRS